MLAALRLLFNASALLVLMALALALGLAALHAQDLPWGHLVLGRLLADAGSIPAHQGLLFTAPLSAPFDASGWVWDWGAWQAYHLYGPMALRACDGVLYFLALWAVAATAFRRGARPFSTAVFAAWALLAARGDLGPGPALFGFTAFCAALWVAEGDFWPAFFGRWIWLGPLAVLAVNVSVAAWLFAPLLACRLAFDGDGQGAPRQPRLAKTAFFVLLIVCLCLHPQGPRALLQVPGTLAFWPLLPGAFEPRQGALLFLAVAVLLVVASSWTREGRRKAGMDAALLFLFGAGALLNAHALPYFLALAAPLAAARFDSLTDALPAPLRLLRWPAKLGAVVGLAFWTLSGGLNAQVSPATKPRPEQTVAFYSQELLDVDILCPAEWTPYLAWKLSPNAHFALDGQGTVLPLRAKALQDALDARGDYAATLAGEGVGLCWLKRGSPLAVALASSQQWQPVSFDDASVVYVTVAPANAEMIRARAPRGLRPGDSDQPLDTTRLVQCEADLEADLARDPSMGVLYLYMAQVWTARGHDAKARETLEGGIRADPAFADNYARLAALRAALGDATDVAAARTLYRRAVSLDDQPGWRQALGALGPG